MRLRIVVSIVAMCAISSDATRSPDLKSVDEAVEECGKLWNVSTESFQEFARTGCGNSTELKELIRCASIKCGWCNVTAQDVIYRVLLNHFNPDSNDPCNLNRTERCMKSALKDIPMTNVVERAFVSYLCYYQHFGTLNRSVQYIPAPELRKQQVAMDVYMIYDVSVETLKDFSDGVFKEGAYECLLRTFLIRSNLYTDKEGPNVKRLYNEDGYESYLTPATALCIEEERKRCPDDKCELVQSTLKNCLPPVHDWVVRVFKDASNTVLQQKS